MASEASFSVARDIAQGGRTAKAKAKSALKRLHTKGGGKDVARGSSRGRGRGAAPAPAIGQPPAKRRRVQARIGDVQQCDICKRMSEEMGSGWRWVSNAHVSRLGRRILRCVCMIVASCLPMAQVRFVIAPTIHGAASQREYCRLLWQLAPLDWRCMTDTIQRDTSTELGILTRPRRFVVGHICHGRSARNITYVFDYLTASRQVQPLTMCLGHVHFHHAPGDEDPNCPWAASQEMENDEGDVVTVPVGAACDQCW